MNTELNHTFIISLIIIIGIIISIIFLNSTVVLIFIIGILTLIFSSYINNWGLNLLSTNNWKLFIKIIIIISSLGVWILIPKKDLNCVILLFFTILASVILISANHLLLIYLALELQTFSIFILICKNRESVLATEAGFKYFVLGAISSGLFLLGVSFIYSQGITFRVLSMSDSFGKSLILISLLFKLTAVPFHMWAPDVYDGASIDTVALISSIPKLSVLAVIINLGFKSNILLLVAILSIIVGTVGALNQTKIKRLIAYSGISHIGFIILGLSLLNNFGLEACNIYIIVYIIMSFVTFSLLLISSPKNLYIVELGNLNRTNKILGYTWTILFLSISGIPPLGGFISKWIILWSSLNYSFYFVSIIVILCSMITAGYYLRIVKTILLQKRSSYFVWDHILSQYKSTINEQTILVGMGLYFMCFLLINPNPWILFSHWGVTNIF